MNTPLTESLPLGCRHDECDAGQYGLCPPCYFSDLLCPVKEHDVFKCVFS